jgi:addiction module RelE/StbE family toxin
VVIWTPAAKFHLKEVKHYIALDSRMYAQRIVKNIVARSKELKKFPQIGRVVPEFGEPDVREIFVYSYRLIYRIVAPDQIEVVALTHGKRNFQLKKDI